MEGRSQHHQLIDENKGFHRDAIDTISNVLAAANRDYHTVAIIGVQNSGKSTLLNHLFGTQFQVLKAQSGTRTTRGIWVSSDKTQNILVFDVEGNDSMDRVEEQDFQKMVATYALVTANVLVINTWSKTLGQHHGSQYETLKIILDICITQFKQQSPKTILFCLRDFNDQSDNQRQIKRKVVDDVADIWRKIQKPKELEMFSDKYEKFFTIEVSCMRKFRADKPQKFIEDAAKLRQKFTNPKAQGYVFAKQRSQFNLPIVDLPQLTQNSWNSIKTNKKLNLPNEKQQLASFRCATILTEVQNQFQKELGDLTEGNLITDFGKLKQKYINQYHSKTYHYGKHVVEQKSKQLTQTIDDVLKKTATQKLDQKAKEVIRQFNQQSKNFSQQSEISLEGQITQIYQAKIDEYVKFMKNLNFQIEGRKQRIEQLSKKLKDNMKQLKQKTLKMNLEQFQNQSSRQTRLLSSSLIKENFGPQFWTKARSSINEKSHGLAQKYRKFHSWISGQELDPIEYSNIQQQIQNQSKQNIKSELQKSLQGKILDQFKIRFNRDEDGSIINFNLKTEEQIRQHFDKTRQFILQLIKRVNEYNDTRRISSIIQEMNQQNNNLFELTWLSNVNEQIDKQMISQFEKIMRRKKQGEMNQVPWWMLAIIFFFVYDDIWFTEQQHPFIHYTLLVIVLVLGTLFSIGQGKVIKQGVRMATDKLKQKIPILR